MSKYSIPFSIYKNYPKAATMGFFSKGPKNEFKIAVINEPSVFEPLKVYSTHNSWYVAIGCLSFCHVISKETAHLFVRLLGKNRILSSTISICHPFSLRPGPVAQSVGHHTDKSVLNAPPIFL